MTAVIVLQEERLILYSLVDSLSISYLFFPASLTIGSVSSATNLARFLPLRCYFFCEGNLSYLIYLYFRSMFYNLFFQSMFLPSSRQKKSFLLSFPSLYHSFLSSVRATLLGRQGKVASPKVYYIDLKKLKPLYLFVLRHLQNIRSLY